MGWCPSSATSKPLLNKCRTFQWGTGTHTSLYQPQAVTGRLYFTTCHVRLFYSLLLHIQGLWCALVTDVFMIGKLTGHMCIADIKSYENRMVIAVNARML